MNYNHPDIAPSKDFYIGLDFDGTVVTHEFPGIGEDTGAIHILRYLIDSGCRIVLNTMRSGSGLEDAKLYLTEKGIELFGCNHNPTQTEWTTSPKVHADLYIDDLALGCPLAYRPNKKPYVDWIRVGQHCYLHQLITSEQLNEAIPKIRKIQQRICEKDNYQ